MHLHIFLFLVFQGFQEHQCAYSKRRSIGRQTPLHRKPSELYNRAQGDTVLQSAAKEQLPPWLLGFQCNERYLKWGDSAQTQLLKIYAARELGKVGPTLHVSCSHCITCEHQRCDVRMVAE